jgi:hypothetical protein
MTIGTDPEFFIKRKETGKYVNAETMFPGTKDEPHMMNSGAGLQTDNVAVEFASPVASDGVDLVVKLRATFNELFGMIPADMILDTTPSAIFDDDQLQTDHAQLFGCSPSYDAWELKENDAPFADKTNMRSIGGHIHVGMVDGDGNDFLDTPYGKVDTVRTMDAFHGIISVYLDNSKESVNRRTLYGSAGEHRPTSYGVEYRTLSAFWLKSPDLVMLIDSLTQDVLALVSSEKHTEVIDEIGDKNIQSIINEGKVAEAKTVMDDILMKYMSEDSKFYLNMCTEKMDTYDFVAEWAV